MRTIVVTGATGFTGRFVVKALHARFPESTLRCVVRPTSDRTAIRAPYVQPVVCDLHDGPGLVAAMAGADALVNVASLGFDWVENIVAAASGASLERAVFISTTAILTTLPAKSKPRRERGEQLVRHSVLPWTILRPTMIYGTGQDRNLSRLIRFVRRAPIVPLVAPGALLQPVHVEDVACAAAEVLAHGSTLRQTYNLSGAEPLTLRDLVTEVLSATKCRRMVCVIPSAPVISLLSLWSRFGTPPVSVEQVQRLHEDKHFDHAEAARDFGFSPRSFREGIRQEVDEMSARARP